MLATSIASGVVILLASLPGFVVLARHEWVRSGRALFLLSPACVFYLAYLASFAVRPPFQVAGILGYDFAGATDTTLLIAQGTSLLTWYGFVLAYALTPAPSVPRLVLQPPVPAIDRRLRAATAYVLSCAASAAFTLSLPPLGAFSLEGFGNMRVAYLNALFGAGYLYLFNLLAGTLLLIGLVFASFCRRPPKLLALVAWSAYLIPNALVTNRFLISAALFALLFVAALKRIRERRRISPRTVILVLVALAAVGAALGLLRGLSEGLEYAEERRNPLVFLLWTFDMSEFYQLALQNLHGFDLGRSWLEDMFLQYLPRAVFPWKPQIYGAVRLESLAMPGSLSPDGVLSATYPISMFGEAYANFGFPGLFLVGLMAGAVLKVVFTQALRAGLSLRRPFWPLACFCLFVLACANALGYLRSFGWFLSTLAFHTVVYAACYFAVWVVVEVLRGAVEQMLASDGGGRRDRMSPVAVRDR